MRRYINSSRTRSNIYDTSALRDQFIRQLTQEATSLLKQLSDEFTQTLQAQATQVFQGIAADSLGATTADAATGSSSSTIGGIGKLLSTGARYLISRPVTTHQTQETSRSIASNSQFKVSAAQAAAEAQQAIGKGDKNL